jgi:hypothetical protein
VAANTLTSWQKWVSITLNGTGTAGIVYATVDGSTPTVGGADCTAISVPATGSVTAVLKNLLPAAELSATTPAATDPSAVPAFTTAQTKVSLIGTFATNPPTYNIELSNSPGAATVLA